MISSYRVQQRNFLLKILQALTAQLDLDVVLEMILQAATSLLSGQAGLIALRQRDGELAVEAAHGLPSRLLGYFSVLLADVPERANHSDFVIPDLTDRLRQVVEETGLPLQQVIALPMSIGRDLIGVLYVFRVHGGGFTANERQILTSFADQAAIAVHNAQLYERLSYEKRRLNAIMEYSADGVMVLDSGQNIVIFNRALEELTGWDAAEALGRHYDEVIRWCDRETKMDLARAIAGGWPLVTDRGPTGPLYVEGDLRRKSGGRVSVGITYAPLVDREGRLVNIIANVRDISRFREADRLKNTFVSMVSHELKTPVTIIQGYAETLNRSDAKWDQTEMREGLSVIAEETQRLSRLIDDLLDVSRLQAGMPSLQMEEVALGSLVKRVVERFQPQTEEHELSTRFPSEFPTVRGDPGRLEQVLDNLVSNAIKYSPEGGQVMVRGRVRPSEILVTVTDEGIGIPATEQGRIFEPFYRVDGSRRRETHGAGLGLYLAKAIVEAHGGRIWVESKPGEGSCFSIALPRKGEEVERKRLPQVLARPSNA